MITLQREVGPLIVSWLPGYTIASHYFKSECTDRCALGKSSLRSGGESLDQDDTFETTDIRTDYHDTQCTEFSEKRYITYNT